ncbi:MAG: hypothetical protein ABI461_12240 [Polyangiaceae bacterium]
MLRSTVLGIAIFSLGLGPCDKVKGMISPQPAATPDPGDTQLTAGPVVSPEDQLMAEATQLCTAGDCQSAHDRLAVGLPTTSPVRQSPAFKDIENKWATATVNGAGDDPDLLARRKQLADVVASTAIDPALKNRAAQTLAALPTQPPPDPTNAPVVDAGSPKTPPPKKKPHH